MRATVRQATAADVPRLVAMGAEFHHASQWAARGAYCPDSVTAIATGVLGSGFILVAEVDGEPVGMLAIYVAPWAMNMAIIQGTEVVWFVEPGARGAGAAIKLLRQARTEAAARGCRWLTMTALSDSPPQAAALYVRLGYVPVETSYLLEL